MKLPPPRELERICKGIAALDAMVSEDWQYRAYSFTATWGADRMASMRNGAGDDWFIVFARAGVFVKSFWHEYEHEDVAAIYKGIPVGLAPLVREPSFLMEDVTFGGFHDGTKWTLRGNAKPLVEEFAVLSGDAAAYQSYIAAVFDVKLPLDAIAHVLAGKPLDAKLVARITKDRTLAELRAELAEISYGTSAAPARPPVRRGTPKTARARRRRSRG